MGGRISINKKEEIKKYYINNYLNYTQIANILGNDITRADVGTFLRDVCDVPRMSITTKKVYNSDKEIRQLAKNHFSINKISETLGLNRKALTQYINKNNIKITPYKPKTRPKIIKLYNEYRDRLYRLANDGLIKSKVLEKIPVTENELQCILYHDNDLNQLFIENHKLYVIKCSENSARQKYIKERKEHYKFDDLVGEIWQPVKSDPTYFVSNMGRVKHYLKVIDAYRLLKLQLNKRTGYIMSPFGNLHKLVATVYCKKPDVDEPLEVNHINGDKTDNRAENLEWVTKKENANHALYVLYKRKYSPKIGNFKKVVVDDKYVFSTMRACEKFLHIEIGVLGKLFHSKNKDVIFLNNRKIELIR